MMPLAGCATGGDGGAAATWTPPFCTIVAADTSDFSYLSCPRCELALPNGAASCFACAGSGGVQPVPPARVYRLLLSLATHDRIVPVVLFDRAARTLTGCPADDLAHFFAAHPGSAGAAAEALRGEMCRVVLRAPTRSKRGAGAADERLRVVSVVPLRDGFRPVADALRTLYPRG